MKKESLAALAILGLISAPSAFSSEDRSNDERCFGVAKKGMNDCGNKHHGCGGKSQVDGQTDEWMYVPKGLCKKLAGGSLESKPHNPKKKK